MPPDIVARVRFYATEDGGREGATAEDQWRGILEFEGEKFSCFMFLDKIGSIAPGMTAVVPISFLYPAYIKPRLAVGSSFTLWEFRTIAEGLVEEIPPDLEERTISEPVRIKLVSELKMGDELSRRVSSRAAEGRMRVYVPVGTPSGREEDFTQGGFRVETDYPAIKYVYRLMAGDGSCTLIFPDHLRRITDRNDFLTASGHKYFVDSRDTVYLYLRGIDSSFKRILRLASDASHYQRVGILTTMTNALEQGNKLSDDAISELAQMATDVLIGIYDEEGLGIWTLTSGPLPNK